MRPTFFIIGAPKCATTSWAAYLSAHPQVSISDPKETYYFCSDLRSKYHPRIQTDAEYEALFRGSPGVRAAGEATPLYLFSSDAVSRIKAYAPDARIIVLLRRQPGYVWSLHQQFLYRRIERIDDPRLAWDLSGRRDFAEFEEPELSGKLLDYKVMADFKVHVNRVLEAFPPDQLLVSWMEDWEHDPSWLWSQICSFIGVDQILPPDFTKKNQAKYHWSSAISRITNRPPRALLTVAELARSVLRVRRLRIAEKIRKVNKRDGYRFPMTPTIATEIASVFEKSNRQLNSRLKALGCLYAPPGTGVGDDAIARSNSLS